MNTNMNEEPDPAVASTDAATAASQLHEAAAAARRVAVEGSASLSAWLTGLAAASAVYLATLGWFTLNDEVPILGISLAFMVIVGAISVVHLRRVRASSLGFSRRLGLAVGGWGAVFGVSLALGLLAFPGSVLYFAIAAAFTAVPPLWGSVRELVVLRG